MNTLIVAPGAPGIGTYREDGTMDWPQTDVYGRPFVAANTVVYRVDERTFAVVPPQDAADIDAVRVEALDLGSSSAPAPTAEQPEGA